MKYTQYSNTFASVGAEGETDDLKAICKTIIKCNGRNRKVQMPLVKWATFEGCRRLKKDIKELHCIEIECDNGSLSFKDAAICLHEHGFPFIGYETWSNQPELERWRFVLPLDKPLTVEEYGSVERLAMTHSEFVSDIASVLGEGVLSRESWNLAQCWYMGHRIGGSNPKLISNL